MSMRYELPAPPTYQEFLGKERCQWYAQEYNELSRFSEIIKFGFFTEESPGEPGKNENYQGLIPRDSESVGLR